MLGILLSIDTGDLDLSKWRLSLGEVREQTAAFLLEAVPGEFGEYPTLGLAIRKHLAGPGDPMLPTATIKQMHYCSIPADQFIQTPSGYELTFK